MSLVRGMELQKFGPPEELKIQGRASSAKNVLAGAERAGVANGTERAYRAEISEEGRSRLNQIDLPPSPEEDLKTQGILGFIMQARMEHMKLTDRLEGKEAGSDLEYLTRSYDAMVSNPRNYFDILGKYGNVSGKDAFYGAIDTVFESVAKKLQQNEAEKVISSLGIDKTTAEGKKEADELIESANKQAELFSSSFLEAYKKGGTGAFESAMDKLNSMKETDSLSSISYKDFQIVSGGFGSGSANRQDAIDGMLDNSVLSDFMKNWLSDFR